MEGWGLQEWEVDWFPEQKYKIKYLTLLRTHLQEHMDITITIWSEGHIYIIAFMLNQASW